MELDKEIAKPLEISSKSECKSFLFTFSLGASIALGSLSYGYNQAIYNEMQDYISAKNNWNSDDEIYYTALISSFLCLGAFLGVFIVWFVGEKYSRKIFILAIDILFIFGSIFCLIGVPSLLILGRFFSGVGMGINSIIVPIFLREISSNDTRGKICGLHESAVCLGLLLAYFTDLGLPIPNENLEYESLSNQWWRLQFMIPIFLATLRSSLIFLHYKMDSPFSLFFRGQEGSAKLMLSKLINEEFIPLYLNQFEKERKRHQEYISFGLKDLLSHNYRRMFLLCFLLSTLKQLSGIDAVIYYTAKMFQGSERNISIIIGRYLAVLWAFVRMCTAFFTTTFIDKFGRRPLFLFGTLALSISLLFLSIFTYSANYYTKSVFLYTFIISYSLSFGPLIWIYAPEILPAKGLIVIMGNNWVFAFTIVFTYPYLVKCIGEGAIYLFYMGFAIIGFIVIYFFLEESARRTREEIFDSYKKASVDSN